MLLATGSEDCRVGGGWWWWWGGGLDLGPLKFPIGIRIMYGNVNIVSFGVLLCELRHLVLA